MSEPKFADRVARSTYLAAELSIASGPPIDQPWRAEAACRFAAPDMFFDESRTEEVKAEFCSACPVRRECLEYAMSMSANQCGGGVWGGMNDTELRKERRRRSTLRYKAKLAQRQGERT